MKEHNINGHESQYKGYTAIFTKKDRNKTILIPWFTDFLSPLIPAVAKVAGYNFVNCAKSSKISANKGLKYGHNEVCYPATLILGDIIAEIETGKYPIDNLAVAITQTGGQCRATNYLSFIKIGLKNAGYGSIPVISVAFGDVHQNEQPGFRLPIIKLLPLIIKAFLFGDSLNQIYSSAVIRAKCPKQVEVLFDNYMSKAVKLVEQNRHKSLLPLLNEAVEEFNKIEQIPDKEFPKIGLIGEIFVKYSNYGQANITHWLRQQGYEVVVPPMIQFFTQAFVNQRVNSFNGIIKVSFLAKLLMPFFKKLLERKVMMFDKAIAKSKFYKLSKSVFEVAKYAQELIDLSNQFGEGWLIAGEIANFAKEGVNKVVCIQPFGCIANHVVAKGIERRIKKLYPTMNILFLDIDDGTAEVNLQNRLKFLIN